MGRITRIYVATVTIVAALFAALIYWRAPELPSSMMSDALLLCCLAVTGELLGYVLPRAATGSIGYIPYFAAAIIVPGWPSVLAVALVRTAVEVWARRPLMKAVLNVSTHAIAESTAISVYLLLGGVSFRSIENIHDLTHVTRIAALPAILGFIVAAVVNHLTVTGAIALSSGRTVAEILRANHNRANAGLDAMAWPLVFVFAWVYTAFGPVAAAALWVPILGLRQFHRTNLDLEQTNEELLELMVKSIEARDPYTSGHSRRVRSFSVTIARAIGLKESQIEQIGRAALLHDVGKIYEKYAKVLAKQDKLTAEEWAIIQDHPVDGASLVSTMTRLRDLVPPVRHHHENWDGTGYPDRIAGETIPLAARIIRFADTIDAMTSERPYRRPLSEAQVRAEIIRCRGSQFDPGMADRLLASPLWHTMFVPESNERSIAPLTIVASETKKTPRIGVAKVMRGA